MKQKTAIKLLIDHLTLLHTSWGNNIKIETVINLAKQLEPVSEQQIKHAYDQHRCVGNFESGTDYFNETFEKE